MDCAREAHAGGAALLVAPELALTGYPPEDLLLRPAFMQACARELAALATALAAFDGLTVVVGHPHQFEGQGDQRTRSHAVVQRFNAASVLAGGQVQATYCKRELPNYQVFDERRYFVSGRDAGQGAVVFTAGGRRIGLLICEDAWFDEPAQAARAAAGAQLLCRGQCLALSLGQEPKSANRHMVRPRPVPAACRWSTRTWSAARTRWCSTALLLRVDAQGSGELRAQRVA